MSKSAMEVANKYEKTIPYTLEKVEELAEQEKLVNKEVLLRFKRIKNNMVLVRKVYLFPNTSKIIVPGQPNFNSKNEPIYEVLMVGDKTDDYNMNVSVGDLVLIDAALPYKHEGTTKALTNNDVYLGMYLMANISNVVAVVDYELIK